MCPRCRTGSRTDLIGREVYWDKPFEGEVLSEVCWTCLRELTAIMRRTAPIYVKV